MRTAAEILDETIEKSTNTPNQTLEERFRTLWWCFDPPVGKRIILKAINEARKEAIEAAAEEAIKAWNERRFSKQSILSLIDEMEL